MGFSLCLYCYHVGIDFMELSNSLVSQPTHLLVYSAVLGWKKVLNWAGNGLVITEVYSV